MSPFYAKAALFTKGHNGLIDKIKQQIVCDKPIVWFHCASLGEFEQGRPIMEAYRLKHPGHKIVLTFFSPSGYEVKKGSPAADWIFYLPLDTKRNARRFLDVVQPAKAIFVKYEFWYNFLIALKRRNIPTYVVAATFRPSQPFFRWYGGFFRKMLRTFTLLFVQNQASSVLLEQIDFTNAVAAGDTRFDRVWMQAHSFCSLPIVDAFCRTSEHHLCVAGSTWPQDEALLLQALYDLPSLKIILVPHEVDLLHITQIVKLFSPFRPVRYSQVSAAEALLNESRVLIVDTIGLLSSIYRFGVTAYVGGGFDAGIHNILEAAVYGVPVLFGPNHQKFNEAVDLIRLGGACTICTKQEIITHLSRWMSDEDARIEAGQVCREYVNNHLGATQTIIDLI